MASHRPCAVKRTPSRRLLVAFGVASGLTATLITSAASATPAPTTATTKAGGQTVASVTSKLTQLARQNEDLTEEFNLAQTAVLAQQQKAAAASIAAADAEQSYRTQRSELGQTVAAQYEGSVFSQAGALLTSDSGATYLDRMRDLSTLTVHQGDMLGQLSQARQTADAAKVTAASLLADATATRDTLAQQRTKLTADIAKYTGLLATLSAAQQLAFKTRNQASPAVVAAVVSTVHAGNAAAQKAVNFALKQVGKPYVYATDGPATFDCSGLTMASWAAAGVSLPHNSAAQSHIGTLVAETALQPGDLIFFYHPIGHVTIYIGDGLMVSAPEPGENVQVVPLSHFQGDYVSATRLT